MKEKIKQLEEMVKGLIVKVEQGEKLQKAPEPYWTNRNQWSPLFTRRSTFKYSMALVTPFPQSMKLSNVFAYLDKYAFFREVDNKIIVCHEFEKVFI